MSLCDISPTPWGNLPLKGKAINVTTISKGFPYEGKLSPQVTDEVYAEH
ncbi:MAG: hypothetical protein IKK49_07160 [Clostridia bacterium]|nr:hypothetical protein [Clostridia bacterium]